MAPHLLPPCQPPLGDDDVEGRDEDVVVEGVGLGVEADLQSVAVVRVQPEVGQEEVDQELLVVGDVGEAAAGEGLLGLEEEGLEVADDGLAEAEDDVVGVQPRVDVGRGLAQLDARHRRRLRHLLPAAVSEINITIPGISLLTLHQNEDFVAQDLDIAKGFLL